MNLRNRIQLQNHISILCQKINERRYDDNIKEHLENACLQIEGHSTEKDNDINGKMILFGKITYSWRHKVMSHVYVNCV